VLAQRNVNDQTLDKDNRGARYPVFLCCSILCFRVRGLLCEIASLRAKRAVDLMRALLLLRVLCFTIFVDF